jgi:hypothetical protein
MFAENHLENTWHLNDFAEFFFFAESFLARFGQMSSYMSCIRGSTLANGQRVDNDVFSSIVG